MGHKYQSLDMDQSSSKKSYASIADKSLSSSATNQSDGNLSTRQISWLKRILGSDKLVIFHEKQREFKARQKPAILQAFLGVVILFLVALFSTRALYSSEMFQTVELLSSSSNEKIINMIKELPSSESIRDLFLHYAARPHLAGSDNDYELAKWTRNQFSHFGLKNATIETYYPYLNYPAARRLAIVTGPRELLYEASLRETDDKDSTPTFHAYSANGNVTGAVVYVNYGRIDDFILLSKNEIQMNGSICLMRQGDIPSSIKVYLAETFGCIGALIYTDPAVKDTTSSAVHRESVQYGFIHPGDPFTLGYGATLNATRHNAAVNLPKIPSLPISWNDALPLLRATQDHGLIEPSWVGNGINEVGYFTGPSIALCNLVNLNEFKMKPIWNVFAHIKGHEEHDKVIVIGNHRDAWDHGAADPSSGSAVLLELARVLGILLEQGWKPRRSIILASWDANEYGNVGSTEWVEDHLHWLDKDAIAYLNIDHAVAGSHFSAQASPLLNRLVYEVTCMVIDPKSSKSIYDAWLEETLAKKDKFTSLIQPIGSTPGLDSIAFFEYAGISSLSMSFDGDNYNVSHSTFDSISWMEQVDPTFEYHQTMVKIWGLLVLRLSSDTILPLHPVDYALIMKRYLGQLTTHDNQTMKHDLSKLSSALHAFEKTSVKFRNKMQSLKETAKTSKKISKQISRANDRLVKLERAFVNKGLLVDRPWYKHAIFAPSAKTGLMLAFPSIVESRDLKDLKKVSQVENALVEILQNAQSVLLKGKSKHHDILDEDDVILDDD